MKKRVKRGLLALSLLMAAGFVVLNVLAYNHAHSMTHFTAAQRRTGSPEGLSFGAKVKVLLAGVNLPRPTSERPPTDLAADCRAVEIEGPGDVTLAAWYCDRGETSPLVILFHGYTAEKTSLLTEARAMLELGASVLLVDFRGSGQSSESYTTIGVLEADDVAAVVRYADTNLVHRSTSLFGQSMGAVAILRAVHVHGIQPDAVIVEAVFDTMLSTVQNRFEAMGVPSFPGAQLLMFWGGRQWGFDGFAHNPIDYAGSLDCPILFMHGTDDPRAKLAEGRRVFSAVGSAKEFLEFEAVAHEPYVSKHPTRWRRAVAEFLDVTQSKSDGNR